MKNNVPPSTVAAQVTSPPPDIKFYFPNDNTSIPVDYENGDGVGIGDYPAESGYITEALNKNNWKSTRYPDNTDYGLNGCSSGSTTSANTTNCEQIIIWNGKTYYGWIDGLLIEDIAEYIVGTAPATKISISGYASIDGQNEAAQANQRLSDDRAKFAEEKFKTALLLIGDTQISDRFERTQGEGDTNSCSDVNAEVDTLCKKSDRYCKITFRYEPTLDTQIMSAAKTPTTSASVEKIDVANDIKKRFFNECDYFEKLKKDDAFVYKSIKDKIKYFNPSFHSMTPEGFNSRLNFLHQCTRQGATSGRANTPSNLSFGVAPVCILRVGDFYHTKIVIDNLDLSFDPLVWDLNPEGVGVQPMICNVTLSFKFIGGSSLQGPINRLQNAVSFNYFANTEIYDDRADSIKISTTQNDDGDEILKGEIVNGINPNNFSKDGKGRYEGLGDFNSIYGIKPGIQEGPPTDTNQTEIANNNSSDTQVSQS